MWSSSWSVVLLVCGRPGLWLSWSVVLLLVCGLWSSSWSVAFLVCGPPGLWSSWSVVLLVCSLTSCSEDVLSLLLSLVCVWSTRAIECQISV
ncbi:hypothetical protein F2P81_025116 [Scophthalmus maximus]|uniref:Uncharacterized protein n=1 Tax=Scophthalmus maximus TaxID=52904 RepID=A0A6A4RT01_SCOMX|nr:hypothetical protein F2P81_025116 [Scophthalmus maximus]